MDKATAAVLTFLTIEAPITTLYTPVLCSGLVMRGLWPRFVFLL
jgi:hypothetical protein